MKSLGDLDLIDRLRHSIVNCSAVPPRTDRRDEPIIWDLAPTERASALSHVSARCGASRRESFETSALSFFGVTHRIRKTTFPERVGSPAVPAMVATDGTRPLPCLIGLIQISQKHCPEAGSSASGTRRVTCGGRVTHRLRARDHTPLWLCVRRYFFASPSAFFLACNSARRASFSFILRCRSM